MESQTKMPFKSLSATIVGLALLVTPAAVPVLAQEGAKPITSQKKVTLLASDSTLIAKASKSKAVSFSSSDGSASGSITWTGTKNFNYRFTLKSKSGNPVYIDAQGFRDFAPDGTPRRMTGNTTSKMGQLFSGSFSGQRGELKLTGVYLRVCTDKSFARDTCGPRRAIRR
jgi:hypothetical protein